MLRTIGTAFGMVVLVGVLTADEPKSKVKPDAKKVAKETAVTVVKVDADKKTIRVRLVDGRQMDLTVEADTKFMGPKGDMSDQGIKDHRLHAGAPIKVVMDGESLKEVYLPLPNIRERQPGGAKPAAAPTVKPKGDKAKDDKKDSTTKDK
jgi:hypothetical protein